MIGRLDGLDGLRGLAMLGVIFCHLSIFTIGWIGLPSFFVLSGFLITRVLLGDRAESDTLRAYFGRFYLRRALRVFPIYYLYLLVVTAAVLSIPKLARLQGELPWAWTYLYNFRMIASAEHSRLLGHLWSLSVEEQFYLVWPWLIAFAPRRVIPAVCLALIGMGPLVREWVCNGLLPAFGYGGERAPIYTYVFTASHLDAFALGALINFVQWRPRIWHIVALIGGALAVGFAVNGGYGMEALSMGWPLFMPHGQQYAWGYTVINVVWFTVICAILTGGPIKRFFCLGVLDYLGKRSYSTYLLHFPMLVLMQPLLNTAIAMFGRVPGTLLFAVPYLAAVVLASDLTYRHIEVPINALKDRFHASRKTARTAPAADHAGRSRVGLALLPVPPAAGNDRTGA
ncbi:acyltransferase [Fontimonas sp. SYSU GA230001]|uniref:acyltransferase family protein n=1 Tax=Fontimonas sp. SYSU GA230001 TaxID=3142450 RepID=UPI0032B5CD3A